ncbi:hypothetical protein GZL_06503 [Streptomyces sp. 769]|nr:hypothetical protein GZL_06503 [Streptomyces sp. 769]
MPAGTARRAALPSPDLHPQMTALRAGLLSRRPTSTPR